jgi:hypothetical protein
MYNVMTTKKNAVEFARKNSGALIIGAALIVGLNFGRFSDYAIGASRIFNLAIYHLSGRADADQTAAMHVQAEERAEAAQRALQEQNRLAIFNAEMAAWIEFLDVARKEFSQIKVVKNTSGGDYLCIDRFSLFGFQEDVSKYPIRDSIADAFVKWLNDKKLLNHENWDYAILQNYAYSYYTGCLSPKEIWRANRYEKRID